MDRGEETIGRTPTSPVGTAQPCAEATRDASDRGTAVVAAVVPFFDAGLYVEHALASIYAQQRPPAEVVVVDDGSAPEHRAILSRLQRRYGFLVIEQPNRGLAGARNTGIARTSSPFLAFLDADDIWEPGYLAAVLARFWDREVGVAFSRLRWIDPEGRALGFVSRRSRKPSLRSLLFRNFVGSGSNFVARRELFERIGGFDEDLLIAEDHDFLLRVLVDGRWRMEQAPEVLVRYRKRPGSLSERLSAVSPSYDRIFEKLSPGLRPATRALMRLGFARQKLVLALGPLRRALYRAPSRARGGR